MALKFHGSQVKQRRLYSVEKGVSLTLAELYVEEKIVSSKTKGHTLSNDSKVGRDVPMETLGL